MTISKMISHIKDNKVEWTCKVKVVEKRNIRDARVSPNKYRTYVLQDEEGTKVLAMANSGDIDQIDRVLEINKTYKITNAAVLPTKYNVPPPSAHYNYVWMISRQTYIEPVPDSEQIEIGDEPEEMLTPFYEFYNLSTSKTPINFMAIVIEKMPREYISVSGKAKTAYDFTIVNEEMKPMLLTLWEEFAMNEGKQIMTLLESGRMPIILGKRVVVTPFNGVSLSTRFDSIFVVNPTHPNSKPLKKWRDESVELIKRFIDLKAYKDALIALAYPPGRLKTKIADICQLDTQVKGVWVVVDIRFVDTTANYYIGCDYCNRKVCGPEGGSYTCLDCGNLNARGERKYRMEVELSDESGQIQGTIFNEDFNRLLLITKTTHRSGAIYISQLQAKMDRKSFICEVRVDNKQFQGRSRQKYTINGVCENVVLSESITAERNKEPSSSQVSIIRRLSFEGVSELPGEITKAASEEGSPQEKPSKKIKK